MDDWLFEKQRLHREPQVMTATPTPNPNKDAIAAKTRTLSYECGHCGLYHSLPVETAANILALIDSEATKRVKEFTGEVQNNLVTSHLKWGDMNLAQQIVSDTLTRFIGDKSQ